MGIGKAAGTGAVAAPAMTMESGVQSPEDYWNRKIQEAKLGAVLGGGMAGAGEAISVIAGKLRGQLPPEAQAIQDLGDKFGVRTLAPDLAANQPGLAKTAVLAESVPGSGMVAQRVAQQAEARAAAQNLLDKYGIEGDIPNTIQQGLKNNFAEVRNTKNALYNDVANAAGDKRIPLPSTFDALQKATEEAQTSGLPESSIQKVVDTLKSRLYMGRDEAGRMLAPAADTTFTGMQRTRSDISDEIGRLLAANDAKGANILQGVKSAINKDMQEFATRGGDETVANAWNKADRFYQNQYAPLKEKMLQNAAKSSEPDQIYKMIVGAGPDRAQKFYNALDANGQAAVRSQMIQNAWDAATQKDGVFSPAKFAQSLEKGEGQTGVFFKGADKFELDGFTNLMRHIQRAGQINENPTNGQRLIQYAMLGEGGMAGVGAAMGHPAALATPAASIGAARLFTALVSSPAGKKLLLSASDLAPASTAMENLVTTKLPAVMALGGSKNVIPFKATLPAAASKPNPSDTEVAQMEQK
jgi:hypothetical protein